MIPDTIQRVFAKLSTNKEDMCYVTTLLETDEVRIVLTNGTKRVERTVSYIDLLDRPSPIEAYQYIIQELLKELHNG